MIAKHVPMNSAKKSDFAGLVKYITGAQDKGERIGQVHLTNCHSAQTEFAILEVLNTQAFNTRASADKTYHLIVSFRAGEMPDENTLKAIEERLCAGLGFREHQRVSVAHHDTDNLHIHIAVNKIHPTRKTMHEPFNAYYLLGQLCDKLEDEFGLEKDNHKASKVGGENRASDMESHAAVESLLGWIKRECKNNIQEARSWEALHQVMRENGLRIHERANGLVITSDSGVNVKASSVSREFSKASLEARLGNFTSPPETVGKVKPARGYAKQPMRSRINTVELYARYQAAQTLATNSRAAEWSKVVSRKNRLNEDVKRNGRLKRAAIKLMRAPGISKKLMYASTSKTLRDDIAAINRQYLKDRQEIYEKYQRRAWSDWLRSEAMNGDQEALGALRASESATGLKGDTLGRKDGAKRSMSSTKHDNITKKGTIIYRVGASAIRDDGNKLKVSRGVDQAGLEAALRMAIERYGSRIGVNGSAAFQEKIAVIAATLKLPVSFDDDALERRRQQLTHATTAPESKYGNDRNNDGNAIGRRPDRSRDGGARQAAATASNGTATANTHTAAHGSKPDARRAGQTPPPEARHGVRGLSKFGVVHVTSRGEVLLPGHVPDHVEHQGSKPDHGLRRNPGRPGLLKPGGWHAKVAASGTDNRDRMAAPPHQVNPQGGARPPSGKPNLGLVGSAPPPESKDRLRRLSQLGAIVIGEPVRELPKAPTTPLANEMHVGSKDIKQRDIAFKTRSLGQAAANKYIAEREQKRARGLNILKHVPYTVTKHGFSEYAGTRRIDGQALALLKQGDEVMVLPVDDATVRRLKRVEIGQQLVVTEQGTVKTKGWSR